MREKAKWIVTYCLIAVLIAGVAVVAAIGIATMNTVSAMSLRNDEQSGDINAQIAELKKLASSENTAQEDDVTIAGTYVIRSTLAISDAYKSGDTSALSDKQKETLDMAKQVVDEVIKEGMTDYEKEFAVFEWMRGNLKNDGGLLVVIPTTQADCDNPYGVLKYKNAVCVGYATTFRLFMQMLGIECMVVHDTSAVHSWDLIKLDNEWYHTDVYSAMQSADYLNFNMDDILCSVSHSWDTKFFPAANGKKYYYGAQHNTKLKDIYAIPQAIKEASDRGETGVYYVFEQTITEEEAQKAEYMMNIIANTLPTVSNGDYSWVSWSWAAFEGNFMLTVSMAKNEETTTPEPDENAQIKLREAIIEAFGEYVDYYEQTEEEGYIGEDDYIAKG